ERSMSADSRPGSVSAVTSCPSALSAPATSSHAHAPSHQPGTRMIGGVVIARRYPAPPTGESRPSVHDEPPHDERRRRVLVQVNRERALVAGHDGHPPH